MGVKGLNRGTDEPDYIQASSSLSPFRRLNQTPSSHLTYQTQKAYCHAVAVAMQHGNLPAYARSLPLLSRGLAPSSPCRQSACIFWMSGSLLSEAPVEGRAFCQFGDDEASVDFLLRFSPAVPSRGWGRTFIGTGESWCWDGGCAVGCSG
jgi:hypothetical protein